MSMKFSIDTSIIERFPDVKVGVLVVRGADNRAAQDKTVEHLRKAEANVRAQMTTEQLGTTPKIADWRSAYKSFGFKPSSYRCSVEALLRRVLQGKDLPDINPLVNLYNAISIKHTLPCGGDDIDQIDGSISLTIAKGGEPFIMLGSREEDVALTGEVIYRDEKEVLCRAWNYRECDKTKITHDTKDLALAIEGLGSTSHAEIATALKELQAAIESLCGGTATPYLLDKDAPVLAEETLLCNRAIAAEKPDYHSYEDFQKRSEKVEEIRKLGMAPYPHKYEPTHYAGDLQSKYEGQTVGTSEDGESGKSDTASIAGRIMLFRAMGKNIFLTVQDHSGRIQLMCSRDTTRVHGLPKGDLSPIKFIEKKLDLGDIIGVRGNLFRTQKGELTLFVHELTLLTKSLLPLPDKHKGLADKGTRYRKRWLDLITNKDVLDTFTMRSKLTSGIRRYFEELDFLEVETPILQNIYGGAEARPFTTHHNALSQDMYLRIAIEISLKKLIVGGMNRVFEIGKVFRNEGIDRTHNPEFTMLEAYAAYWDYNDVMACVENLFAQLAISLFGSTQIGMRKDKEGNEYPIDLKTPWKRMTMKESIKTYGNIDVDALSDDEMRALLEKTAIDRAKLKTTRGKLIAYLFEEFAEHKLIHPHHITDHPIETTPLCKLHRDPKDRDEGFVERFESFFLGIECCNAYSELNDPKLQRELLEQQHEMRLAGDDEASPMDEEFIEAICQGMPPTGGFGIGIDRLTMLFTGAFSIRDVVLFPVMRPEE